MLTIKHRVLPAPAPAWPRPLIAAVVAVAAAAVAVLTLHPGVGTTRADHMQGPPAVAQPPDPQLAQFQRFALNGLLAPLLDDAEPARWTTVPLHLFCGGGTSVSVDGRPLRSGAAVPARPFTLRWQMDACSPFGETSVLLGGLVELHVEPRHGQMAAVVDARALQITSAAGVVLPAGVFVATLAMGPVVPL